MSISQEAMNASVSANTMENTVELVSVNSVQPSEETT